MSWFSERECTATHGPERSGCLLMIGHEKRGHPLHVDRDGRKWTDEESQATAAQPETRPPPGV